MKNAHAFRDFASEQFVGDPMREPVSALSKVDGAVSETSLEGAGPEPAGISLLNELPEPDLKRGWNWFVLAVRSVETGLAAELPSTASGRRRGDIKLDAAMAADAVDTRPFRFVSATGCRVAGVAAELPSPSLDGGRRKRELLVAMGAGK